MGLHLINVLGVVVLLCGCGGRSVGAAHPDGAAGPDGTLLPDAAPPSECEVRFDTEQLRSTIQGWHSAQVDVTGSWVVYTSTGTGGANLPDDAEVFRLRPTADPEEQISSDDVRTVLLDAEGDAILYGSGSDVPEPMHLWLRTATGVVVDLGVQASALPYGDAVGGFLRRPKLIEGPMAVWSDAAAVKLFDGQATQVIYEDADHIPMTPTMAADTVAFTAHFDGGGELFVYRLSSGLTRLTQSAEHDVAPVVAQDYIYWVCGGGICRYNDAGGQELLASGYCLSPVVHAGQAAWICDGEVQWLRDGEIRTVSEPDVWAATVRLSAGRLAWVENPISEPPPGTDVQVVYYAGGRRHVVAPITLSCEAGHIDTMPSLALGNGLLAWCHSMHEADAEGACFYAKILETGDCGPTG